MSLTYVTKSVISNKQIKTHIKININTLFFPFE